MNYNKLPFAAFFSCKIKKVYVDIYLFYENKFQKVYTLLKDDYPNIIGVGQQGVPINGLVPITLTDETIKFILSKKFGVGAVNVDGGDVVITDGNRQQWQGGDQFTTEVAPENPIDPVEPEKTTVDLVSLLPIVPVVYVPYDYIDCEVIPDEEVEVEDVEEEPKENTDTEEDFSEEEEEIVEDKKDYSKLIWIALGAAALLL